MDFNGIPVTVTHEPGSYQLGKSDDGRGWMRKMGAARGVIKGLDGEGKHETKAWIGPNPQSKAAYVLTQQKADGSHDEEKLALGFNDPVHAVNTIVKHYPDGQHPVNSIRQLTSLEDWVAGNECWAETAHEHHSRPHEHKDPIAYYNGKRLPVEPVNIEKEMEEIAKAFEPQSSEDRWITMHPGGPGSKGTPVLIRPVKGMPGVHRVVGGAGGNLNFMRITLTKKPEDYKTESLSRHKEKRAAENAKLSAMTPEEKQAHQQKETQRKESTKRAESKFIESVLGPDTQGGQTPDLFMGGPGTTPQEQRAYHRERLKQAHAAVTEAARQLTLDADARVSAGLTQIGAGAAPGLTIDQILTVKTDSGPGYNRDIRGRAEENGLTAAKLQEAVQDWREAEGKLPAKPHEPGTPKSKEATQAGTDAYLKAKELQKAKQKATQEAIHEALAANVKMGDLLKARNDLRDAYIAAKAAQTGQVFPPGYACTVSEPTSADKARIVTDISEKLLRSHVESFLDEVEQQNPDSPIIDLNARPEEGMAAARGAAAWGCMHEVGFAIFGQGILDRDTVETLGPEAAAQVMAHAIRNRFTPQEQDEILDALTKHHVAEQHTELSDATREAQSLRAEAQLAKEQMANTPRDFALAAEMHKNRMEALQQARTVLGAALGRFESRAALIASLQATPAKELNVPIGQANPEKAIAAAAAIGLMPGTYALTTKGGEALLTIPQEHIDSMIRAVDSAAVGERELALSIKRGDQDEDGFLPTGFASRPATRYDNQLMEPPQYQRKIELPEGANETHLENAIRRYVGQRWADGERGPAILADLKGTTARDQLPEDMQGALGSVVDRVAPLYEVAKDEQGEPIQETHEGHLVFGPGGKPIYKTRMRDPKAVEQTISDLGREYLHNSNEGDQTLNGQSLDQDSPDFSEALHRTLAEDPRLQAAHAPLGELTGTHEAAIRDWFYRTHAQKRGQQMADAIQALGPEPPKFDEATGGMSLFEDMGPVENPAWVDYQEEIQAINRQHETPGSAWADYVRNMKGLKPAQEAIQSEMQGKLAQRFHHHFTRLTGQQMQLGNADVAHYSTHITAVSSPEEAAKLISAWKAKQASFQKKGGGRFQSASFKEHMEQAGQAALFSQGGSLFGKDERENKPQPDEKWQRPELAPGDRYTLGERMEQQLRAAMPEASAPFESKDFRPVKVREKMSMSGRFAMQQRGVKAFTHLKRMGLFAGAGSGKTSVLLGGASQIIKNGSAKKVIMAVPSIVQAQFGGEAVNFLDPATGIHVHAHPGESYQDRLAAYRDPNKHAVVMTHAAIRDDTVKMLAATKGITEDEAAQWAMSATPEDLKAAVKDAWHVHGADFDALMIDEGHDALNRKGKPDSLLAKIIDAHGENAPYYIGATGSPVKNDSSEAFDWLHKLDPERYPQSAQAEFLRRYGKDSAIVRRALKAELARYFFADRVGSGVTAHRYDHPVTLTAEQNQDIEGITRAAAKLQLGIDPVKWAKQLAPNQFEGQPESEHSAIADRVKRAVGTFREAAMNRAINAHPKGGKLAAAVKIAADHVAEGKPTVVFCHSLDAVRDLHKAMESAGLRVTSLTGADSAKEKGRKLAAFQGGPGRKPEADVIVLSDAGATGANLQRGKALIHVDQANTFKTMEQRTARIDRLGQTSDVDVYNLLADHPWERNAVSRVAKKHMLADIYQGVEGNFDDSGIAETLRELRARQNQTQESAA